MVNLSCTSHKEADEAVEMLQSLHDETQQTGFVAVASWRFKPDAEKVCVATTGGAQSAFALRIGNAADIAPRALSTIQVAAEVVGTVVLTGTLWRRHTDKPTWEAAMKGLLPSLCRRAAAETGLALNFPAMWGVCLQNRERMTLKARVPTKGNCHLALLRASGRHGIFWEMPAWQSGDAYKPIWLEESVSLKVALGLAQRNKQTLGLISGIRRTALRLLLSGSPAEMQDAETNIRIDLGNLAAAPRAARLPRYVVDGVGRHEHPADVEAALSASGWDCTFVGKGRAAKTIIVTAASPPTYYQYTRAWGDPLHVREMELHDRRTAPPQAIPFGRVSKSLKLPAVCTTNLPDADEEETDVADETDEEEEEEMEVEASAAPREQQEQQQHHQRSGSTPATVGSMTTEASSPLPTPIPPPATHDCSFVQRLVVITDKDAAPREWHCACQQGCKDPSQRPLTQRGHPCEFEQCTAAVCAKCRKWMKSRLQ